MRVVVKCRKRETFGVSDSQYCYSMAAEKILWCSLDLILKSFHFCFKLFYIYIYIHICIYGLPLSKTTPVQNYVSSPHGGSEYFQLVDNFGFISTCLSKHSMTRYDFFPPIHLACDKDKKRKNLENFFSRSPVSKQAQNCLRET